MRPFNYLIKAAYLAVLISTSTMAQEHHIPSQPAENDHPDNCGVHYKPKTMNRSTAKVSAVTVQLSWPMRQAVGYNDPSYWCIVNYVDADPTSGILDYYGGSQTYNGHYGTDFTLYPYGWKKVNDNHVEVIAAADGIIETKIDGNVHNHCTWTQPGGWNAVYIRHSDGSLAMYGHMKNGSLTSKQVGDPVIQGEYLGVVASSGRSSGPHLHLELRDASGNVIDPWFGPNNNTITEPIWIDQEPYLPSGLNYVAITGSVNTQPWSPNCPQIEETNEISVFAPGEEVRLVRMYRHEKPDQVTSHRLRRPDGSVVTTWVHNSTNNYTTSWWYNIYNLPLTAQEGIWAYEVEYLGETFIKTFTVSNEVLDCNGDANGTAYVDACGICVGGNSENITVDTDGDGTEDCIDQCPNDVNKTDPGDCGCGVSENCNESTCSGIDPFDINTIYQTAGYQVEYDGIIWENNWYVHGQVPENIPYGAWTLIQYCNDSHELDCTGIPTWNSYETFPNSGMNVLHNGMQYYNQWYTHNEVPGDSPVWQLVGPCGANSYRSFETITQKLVSVTPNPADDIITVSIENAKGAVVIRISDQLGRDLVYLTVEQNTEAITIPVEDLPSGILVVKVLGDNLNEEIRVQKL